MRRKALPQKNTLLKNAQANAESIFSKRVFFSPPNKSTLPFFTNLFFPTHGFSCNRTDTASNVNRFGQSVCKLDTTLLRTDRRATDNMRLASCGVTCLNSSAVFQITFCAWLTVLCPEIPHERQAQKR